MITTGIRKKWTAQTTINIADMVLLQRVSRRRPGRATEAWPRLGVQVADMLRQWAVFHKAVMGSRVVPLGRVNSHDFHQQYVEGQILSSQRVVGIDHDGPF
jgi:hypothetical protein